MKGEVNVQLSNQEEIPFFVTSKFCSGTFHKRYHRITDIVRVENSPTVKIIVKTKEKFFSFFHIGLDNQGHDTFDVVFY